MVEKGLAKEGTTRLALGREAFTERVWAWRREYGGFITDQLRRLGASCDWSRERFTLDDGLSGRHGMWEDKDISLIMYVRYVCEHNVEA